MASISAAFILACEVCLCISLWGALTGSDRSGLANGLLCSDRASVVFGVIDRPWCQIHLRSHALIEIQPSPACPRKHKTGRPTCCSHRPRRLDAHRTIGYYYNEQRTQARACGA